MREMIKRLIAERAEVVEKQRASLDAAEAETRDLTAEEASAFDAQNADIDEYTSRIDELETVMARNRSAEEQRAQYATQLNNGGEARVLSDSRDFRTEFRDLARGHNDAGQLVNEIELDMSGVDARIDRESGGWEVRDLSKLTAGAGADTVPTSMQATLWEHLIENSAIRQTNVTQLRTSAGESVEFPKTTGHSTGALTAEVAAISESDPTFAKVTLGAYKYAVVVQISSELLADSAVDLEGYLAREMGVAIGNNSGAAFITGDGSSKPNGVVPTSTLGVTGAASVSGAFDADDFISLQYSVIAAYADRAWWLMRRATEGAARKLKGTDNHYLWQPSLQVGTPNMLLGRPIVSDPNVPAVALAAKSVLFGDFSRYVIRDVGGIQVRRSDDFAFTNDLVTFKATLRTDGDLIDATGAIKHFIGNAS